MTISFDMELAPPSQSGSLHSIASSESRRILNFSSNSNNNELIADANFQRASHSEMWGTNRLAIHERHTLGTHVGRRGPCDSGPSSLNHGTISILNSAPNQNGQYYLGDYMQASHELSSGSGNSQLQTNSRALASNRLSWAWVLKERRPRRRLIRLVISATFLILLLAIFFAFSVSDTHWGREIHILLIFMIMILGVLFCHSLIRFSMVFFQDAQIATNRIPSRVGPTGYAQPERPIHVTFVSDEEIVSDHHSAVHEKFTIPPPAYGLWRSSVRLNPDLLYWQRVEKHPTAERNSSGKAQLPRPPSYASDDGVNYAVEAQACSYSYYRTTEYR